MTVITHPFCFSKTFSPIYFLAALEILFPPLLIMDLLQRLSFWQANNTVRMKTTVVEKEETIIEINQEQDEENRKATKTNIIITTETMLHLQTINVSININLKHLLVFVLVSSVHYLYSQVQLQMFHKLAHISLDTKCINYYFCIQLSPFTRYIRRFRFSYLFVCS